MLLLLRMVELSLLLRLRLITHDRIASLMGLLLLLLLLRLIADNVVAGLMGLLLLLRLSAHD